MPPSLYRGIAKINSSLNIVIILLPGDSKRTPEKVLRQQEMAGNNKKTKATGYVRHFSYGIVVPRRGWLETILIFMKANA